MPVYEYRCKACGEEFEVFLLGASDPPRCPDCGSAELQKKVSVPCCSTSACGPSPGGFS